jgi:hypothetical protein
MFLHSFTAITTRTFPGRAPENLNPEECRILVDALSRACRQIYSLGSLPEVIMRVMQHFTLRDREALRGVCQTWNNVVCDLRCLSSLRSYKPRASLLHVALQAGDPRYLKYVKTQEEFRMLLPICAGRLTSLGVISALTELFRNIHTPTEWFLDLNHIQWSCLLQKNDIIMEAGARRQLAHCIVNGGLNNDPNRAYKIYYLATYRLDIITYNIPHSAPRITDCNICHMLRLCPEAAIYLRMFRNRQPRTTACQGCRESSVWKRFAERPYTESTGPRGKFVEACRAIK